MPVAVFVLGVGAGLEIMSCRMLLIMSVISVGVLVASYGEMDINWVGVVYQMGGVVGEALRLIFMEILVKRKGLKLNPISVMYYVSPCRYTDSGILYSMICYREDNASVIKVSNSVQCSLSIHSLDLSGETKDGSTWVLELSTPCAITQLSLHLCPQLIRFSCNYTYKCFNHSRCWSC